MGFRLEEFGSSSSGGHSFIGSGLSRGDSQGEMFSPSLASGVNSSPASLCGGQAGRGLENHDPAEPDDPNSSSLNPNDHGKMGMGKEYADKKTPVRRCGCAAVVHPLKAAPRHGSTPAPMDYFRVDFFPRGYLY